MLENLGILHYSWSDKVTSAGNQQGRLQRRTLRDYTSGSCEATAEEHAKAYLLGAIHDGSKHKNTVRISQKGTDWLIVLQTLLFSVGAKSWIYQEGKTRSVFVLETSVKFLDFKANPLTFKTTIEQALYIRGFFDAEGGVPRDRSSRFYIQLVQKDHDKLSRIKMILNDLGIRAGKIHNPSRRVDPNYWRFFISAESQRDFCNIVGSNHPRKCKILRDRMMI